MKKLIKIVIIFGIFLALFVVDLPYILSVFSVDDKIKEYIIENINNQSENVISIEDISVGLWSLEAQNITLIGSEDNNQFVIKNVQFYYNIFNVLKEPSKPENAIKEITLIEPKLIFGQGANKEDLETDISQLSDSMKINYINNIIRFTGISKVQLKDAKIIFKKQTGELVVLADKLNGWLKSNDRYNVTLSAKGSLFYGIDNFNLDFNINFLDEIFAGRIELIDYDINNKRFIIEDKNLFIDHGNFDGRVYLSSNAFFLDSIKCNGFLNVNEVNANFDNIYTQDLAAKIDIKNNAVILDKCKATINNSNFVFTAKIENILNPSIKGTIRSEKFRLSSLDPYVSMEGFNSSAVNLNGNFAITKKDTLFDLKVLSGSLEYNKEIIENLSLYINYLNGNLNIKNFSANYFDFDFTSSGLYNFRNGEIKYFLTGNRKFGTHIFFDNLSEKTQFFELNLKGNVINQEFDGRWNYNISSQNDTILNIQGSSDLYNGIFTFKKDDNKHKEFVFTIQLSEIFKTPQINYGFIQNIPFSLFTSRPWIKSLFNDISFEGILVGSFNDLNAELRLGSFKENENELVLTTKIVDLLKNQKSFTGTWEINQFTGKANFILGEDFLRGEIDSGNKISGGIDLELSRKNQIQANLDLNNFDIGMLFTDNSIDRYGEISGRIVADGDLDNPKISAKIQGDKFVINDIGYYKFGTQFSLTNSLLDLKVFNVLLNNNPIMTGIAQLDLKNNTINATASGEDIDADYIFKSIFGDNYKLNGEAKYDFVVTGSSKSPNISANIDFNNGEIENIKYDNFHIELSDSIINNSNFFDYKNHLINIKNISLIKSGQFHFEGYGTFPLYANGEIDLNLDFDGDLLSLIPKWSTFIVDGASLMSVNLKLAGTPEKLRVIKGIADIERGELWMQDVAKHIDALSGKIEILPGTNKVNFVDLKAGINGNDLVINTIHDVRLINNIKLEPWYFRSLDLDFGILTLSTPQKGIELHIPSLMLENENGYLSLTGKHKTEQFYFAGPVKHPVVRGAVTLSDTRVTYPFPTRKSKEKDVAEEFLENINWDVIFYVGEDLKYEREIDAFLDQVNTELFVNSQEKGLTFKGIINKNTFKVLGNLESDRGRLDYLDLSFRVENFGVEFSEFNQQPRVTGRAWTVVRDSVGAIPKTIYLELYAIDPETGQEIQSARWEDFRFKLVSADPTVGETQEQVLAYLGYSIDNIQNKATEVGGAVTENYLIRPLLRPIERSLEKYLGFDLVRFNSNIAKNLFHVSLGNMPGFNNSKNYLYELNSPYLFLFESSEVTVGKYLSQNLYLTYTGQLVATAIDQSNEFNFNHSIGVEYRLLKNILLEFEYDREMLNYFSTFTDKPYYDDFKIRLRHSFTF